jgi:hypothetical protein
MLNALMMERSATGMPSMGVPGFGTSPGGSPSGMPTGANFLMVPRGKLTFEKCKGGFKIQCACDDKTAASMIQNLCAMLAGGLCSCCLMMNGMPVCSFSLTMGLCTCEPTANGVCITCTSGDKNCCEMIQACCDCAKTMCEAGCTCCVLMNNMPVCCGC